MNKEERFAIIVKVSGKANPSPSEISGLIDAFIKDELMYAGLKAWYRQLDVKEEFKRVLEAYDFEGYSISTNIKNYIRHYSAEPMLAAMQHCDLNDCVSYIGEYYDGTPTHLFRNKSRFEIDPIKIDCEDNHKNN